MKKGAKERAESAKREKREQFLTGLAGLGQKMVYACIAILLTGFLFNIGISQVEKSSLEWPTELVKVGEQQLEVYCVGNKDSDIVLFFCPDFSQDLLQFVKLQRAMRKFKPDIRTCSYNKLGRGRSTGAVNASDIEQNVENLKTLIERERHSDNTKIVVASHASAALLTMSLMFDDKYYEKVDGLVLLEPLPLLLFSGEMGEDVTNLRDYTGRIAHYAHMAAVVGVGRILSLVKPKVIYEHVPEDFASLWTHSLNQARNWDTKNSELADTYASYLLNGTRDGKFDLPLDLPVLHLQAPHYFNHAPELDEVFNRVWEQETFFTQKLSKQFVYKNVGNDLDSLFYSAAAEKTASEITAFLKEKVTN